MIILIRRVLIRLTVDPLTPRFRDTLNTLFRLDRNGFPRRNACDHVHMLNFFFLSFLDILGTPGGNALRLSEVHSACCLR